MAVHFGERFEGVTLDLDAQDFDTCTFVRCVLRYCGGEPPRLSNLNVVDCDCRLEGAALRTIGFLSELYAVGLKDLINDVLAPILGTPELPDAPTGSVN